MNLALPRLAFAILLLALPLLAGCPPRRTPQGTQPQTGKPGAAQQLQFSKIGVGLPSETLAFVGKDDYGIAGASAASKVYFAVRGESGHEVHVADLKSGQTSLVTKMNGMITNSLLVDPQGERLVYTRTRAIDTYVDDPRITEPPLVAVIQSYDLAKGEESAVFEFKQGDWLRYRNASLRPQISHSGKRVAALTYDIDRDNRMRDLDEWLRVSAEYFGGKLSKDDQTQRMARLHEIAAMPHVYSALRDAGTTIDPETKITQAHTAAVRAVRQSITAPQWAVLIGDQGAEPRLIEVKLPPLYAVNPVSLVAVGDDMVLLSTRGKSTTGFPEVKLLRLDEATGAAAEFASYTGAASSVMLSADEWDLLINYLPFDSKSGTLSNQLSLKSIPLDDPTQAKEAVLYPAVPHAFDFADDPKTFAIHSAVDNAIYVSNAGSTPQKVAELLAPVAGLFLTDNGRYLVYAENGILFRIELVDQPQQAKSWVAASQFSKYETAVTSFLSKLGYQIPAGTTFRWEEREGLGLHEVSAVSVDKQGRFENGLLVRYNVEEERVESLFFLGKPWPNPHLPEQSLDAPEAERRAEDFRQRAEWLSDQAEKYQPGSNPLYDGEAGTYVIVYRDGYLLDTPKGEKLVINGESSIRVHKPTGQIVEMSLQTMPEVRNARFKAGDEEIAAAVRNKGQHKYPENAPIRIDTANAKLIVARDKTTHWQPARVEVPTDWRVAWSVDTFIQPENELVFTTWVDVETTKVLGEQYFMPTSTTGSGM